MLLIPAAFAWSHHAWIVEAAVEGAPAVDEVVVVEPIEAWLTADAAGIGATFAAMDTAHDHAPRPFPAAPTAADFLASARLNPATTFALARRLLPGEPATAEVDPASISPALHAAAPWDIHFDTLAPGDSLPAHEVLRSHVDEPDWGFDDALWAVPTYDYGPQPYGLPTGESSKAPFHMRFAYENVLVRLAAPEIASDLPARRAALFVALARRAHATGHDYWAWRLTAWALHYVEDVATPYHSRANPAAKLGWYVDFALAADKEARKMSAAREVGSRHLLYEEAVAFALQSAANGVDPLGLRGALGADDTHTGPDPSLKRTFATTGRLAALHARRVDEAVRIAFVDTPVDLSTATEVPSVDIVGALGRVTSPDRLWQVAREDLALTGEATREVLRQVW